MKPLKPKINYKLMLKDAFFTVFVAALFVVVCWLQPTPATASDGTQIPLNVAALIFAGQTAAFVLVLVIIRKRKHRKHSEDQQNGR